MDLKLHLTNVLKSLIQNAGANKGLFIVSDDKGKLIIEAHVTSTEVVKQDVKIEGDATNIPLSIIQHVLKTQACTIIEDACQSGQFTLDPYIANNNIKSVLCVPVLGQHKLVAVLYLENNTPGSFTKEKVEMIEMFCSQVAFSFEYDTLFKDIQTRNKILEAKNKSLIELDQVKDQFLSNTSHELRTPLNGIIGIAESMIDGATGTLAQSTCNSLAMIVNCGKRMANLVNDIMDISALKAGKLTIRFKSTDLSKTVNEVVSLSEHLVGKKEIKIINEVESLPILNVDEARIQQVLQNIIGNAVKFTQTGKIVVSSETSNDWVRLSVSDSGVGIPEEAYSQIFEDYKQLDTSDEGTGLGLAIAKRIIELHGGTITVKSQLNVGSQFTITFPMKLRSVSSLSSHSHSRSHSPSPSPSLSSSTSSNSSSASSSTSSSSTSNSSQPGEGKPETENKSGHKFYQEGSKATTILSVDDDPTNQAVIHKLLSPYFGIIQAMSGSEALDILHNSPTPPDFILLDVMMPKMSGLEVCERVREKYPACDLPIIMVSAKNKPENIVEGLSKGANDYIGKPINKHELLARIRAQLMICHTCKLASKKPVDSNAPTDDVFICESCRSTLANKSLTGTFTYGPRLSSQELLLSLLHDPANCTEILNYVPMMVTLYDTEGKVVLRNVQARKMVEKIIGVEAVNQSFVPHVKDRALAEKILADVICGTRVEKHIELPLEVSNNSSSTVSTDTTNSQITRDKNVHSLTASLLSLSNSSKGIQGVFVLVAEEDVSQTASLMKDITRLRTINDQKDDLMSDLAHNLKSPFNGIVGLLEAIQDKINSIIASSSSANDKQNKNKDNAAISSMIDLLSTSALRFSRTIDQISDFSELKEENPEAGTVRNSNVSLKEAFEEAHGLFQPLLNLKKIDLSFEFPPSLPVLQTRHRKLVLLLGYLLETAAQYSESLKIHVTAEEKTIENNGKSSNFIKLQFTDSQSLLTTKEIAGLFDPSLGVMKGFISPLLAVAVIRGLGGDVTATTDAEKGGIVISAHIPVICSLSPIVHPCPTTLSSIPPPASFTSKFSTLTVTTPVPLSPSYESQPAHTAAVASLAQKSPTPPASPRPTTPRRPLILSVDDDSIHQVVISNILVQGGFEVVQAGDGQDALDYLSDPNKQFPDLVLLDNMMPRMNGPETCKKIREKFADKYLPILMFSAKNEAGFVTASIQLGCNDVLPKPFAKTELLTKINAFIKVPPIKSTTPRASLRQEKEIESLTRDRNNLREKVKQLEAAAQKKETELQQLNSQMTDLRSLHEKEAEQLENTRKENENIKTQMEEISKEKMQLDTVVTELRNQVTQLQTQYQQTSQQLQQLQQQQLQQQFLQQQRGPTPSPSLSPFRPNMSSSASLSPLSPAPFPPLSASFNSPALSPFRAGYTPSPSLRSSAFNTSFTPPNNNTPPNNHNPLSSFIHQNSSPHSTPSTPSLNSSSPFSNINIHNSTASATPFASPHHSSTIPLNLNNNNNDNERGYLSSDLFAPRSNTELQEEVKQLKAKLNIAETMFNLQKIRIKFRLFQARFYHNVLLPHQQIGVLKEEIAKRLSLTDSAQIAYLVKNGDTIVEFDEDIEDGLVLDIFLREM